MIKIVSENDVSRVGDSDIVSYIKNLIHTLVEEYSNFCPNRSIEAIGAIFLLESSDEIKNHKEKGLNGQIEKSQFEWVADVGGLLQLLYCD